MTNHTQSKQRHLNIVDADEAITHSGKKAGRPRSQDSRQSILDAALKLLYHTSVRDVSIEAIAKKAGVGKTTIYRWWPNKIAVILEAVQASSTSSPSVHSTQSVRASEDFVKQIERFAKIMKGRQGKILAETFAESQGNKDMLASFYQHFMLAHEETLARILAEGQKTGEFRPTLKIELVVDMIYGSLFYKLMSNSETLDQDFIDHLIMENLRFLSDEKPRLMQAAA
jgi:AcrR family transcriptional regulator